MKKVFWTILLTFLLLFLFWAYLRLFNTLLATRLASWFAPCEQCVCQTGSYQVEIPDFSQQFDAIKTQLADITQKLESQSYTTGDQFLFETRVPTKVALYYFNHIADQKLPPEQQINLTSLLPVYRIFPPSKNLLVDVLNELIKGNLTLEEKKQWFLTEFPHPQFVLRSHMLSSDGVLTLEFSEVPGFTSWWSARMLILSNVIVKTMLQFPGVKKVVFVPEELFQP